MSLPVVCIPSGPAKQNLPRLQAGVCSERFPDLMFFAGLVGIASSEESSGDNTGLTDLTNLMVGLAAILFVVGVDKIGRLVGVWKEAGRDVRFSWVFASVVLALLSSLDVLCFHLD